MENGEKTTIGLISKKSNFARAAHFFCTFLCRCFARPQRETSRNFFMEEMSYVFSFTFFSLPLIFSLHWWPLAFLILSRPLQNFHVVLQKKNVSFVFYLLLQISVALFLVEFRWPAAFSLFLCLSPALYCKFVDMTINLSLVLQKTRLFPLSGFVFIDS